MRMKSFYFLGTPTSIALRFFFFVVFDGDRSTDSLPLAVTSHNSILPFRDDIRTHKHSSMTTTVSYFYSTNVQMLWKHFVQSVESQAHSLTHERCEGASKLQLMGTTINTISQRLAWLQRSVVYTSEMIPNKSFVLYERTKILGG